MKKIVGIDHIAIEVSNLKVATEFLKDLGLQIELDLGAEIFFKVGNQKLALFQAKNTTQTINHIALRVENFKGIKKELEKKGYTIYKGDMINGPDGIRIQLIE